MCNCAILELKNIAVEVGRHLAPRSPITILALAAFAQLDLALIQRACLTKPDATTLETLVAKEITYCDCN
jgi:hypothetical protein